MADRPGDDPLDRLRERIAATQEAAERLAGEAAEARRLAGEGRMPPAGWATPSDREAHRELHGEEVERLRKLTGLR